MSLTLSELKELENECSEMNCSSPATHVVYWPGKVPPPKYCEFHAKKAVVILDYMGTPVHYKEIKK